MYVNLRIFLILKNNLNIFKRLVKSYLIFIINLHFLFLFYIRDGVLILVQIFFLLNCLFILGGHIEEECE